MPDCWKCAQKRTYRKGQRWLKLLFPEHRLEYVRMYILDPPKKRQGNQVVVLRTDRYTELTKKISTTETYATTVVRIFLEYWVTTCGIRSKLLTDNGSQFVSNFFVAVCNTLSVNNITTTEFHRQSSCHVKCFNSTLISRLHHYVSEYQMDSDNYLLSLTHVYYEQVDRSIKSGPSSRHLHEAPWTGHRLSKTQLRTVLMLSHRPL